MHKPVLYINRNYKSNRKKHCIMMTHLQFLMIVLIIEPSFSYQVLRHLEKKYKKCSCNYEIT